MSPIAALYLLGLALFSVLQTFFKAILLFSIAAVNIPFAVMFNLTVLAGSMITMERSYSPYFKVDPRVSVGIEVKFIVSDFFKVVAGELLLVLSTGVITFYTAPLLAFYISMAVGVTAILLKWLNTNCLSMTAFLCLCGFSGLNPMIFLFSFIGLFDIGFHPIAKCSFTADKAFLFTNDANHIPYIPYMHISTEDRYQPHNWSVTERIDYPWDAFERGLFQLRPRIEQVINRLDHQYFLRTFMVLYMCEIEFCQYPVDRLELPGDYPKITELLRFLRIVHDGFITDKMRGRYEHSLTLQEIVDGVAKYDGYRIVHSPLNCVFVVAGCTDYGSML